MAEKDAALREQRTEWWKKTAFRWLVFLELLALFGFAYVRLGGLLISQTNHTDKDIRGHDQLHNIRLTTETREDLHPDFRKGFTTPFFNFFPHRTDGVVQPLWPWVAAWFADNDHRLTETDMSKDAPISDQTRGLFNRGRWFNVFMTLSFLCVLGVAACRIFSLPAACNLVLLGGLGAFLPRAAYFQPEPLYYVFFFLTWVACVSALQHNSLWIYGLIGVLGGIAYMAKGSIQPMLGVFIGVSSLRCLWEMVSARRRGFALSSGNLWHWRNHLLGVVVLAIMHLMTIGPRLGDAREKFGDPFHSFPGYWMWMDNYPQAYEWMDKHNTPEELAAMLPHERPCLSNFLRTHSREDFINRLWNGTCSRLVEFFHPPQKRPGRNIEKWSGWRNVLDSRGWYLAALAGILAAMLIVLLSATPKAQHAGHVVFRHGTTTILLFVLGSSAVYSLAFGFYAPIALGSGDRFMLSLYLPLAFSFIWGAEAIIRRVRRRKGSPWIIRGYLLAQWMLFAAITWRVIEVLRVPKFYNG